jgi:hypothetical protein
VTHPAGPVFSRQLVNAARDWRFRGLLMSRYLYHLRRRNGRTQMELDIHDGEPPGIGTVVNVIVADETVPARIGHRTLAPTLDGCAPIFHVYVDEIESG